MKNFSHTCIITLAALVAVVAGCTSDDSAEGGSPSYNGGLLTLRIATQNETRGRTVEWKDDNGLDEEMMNLWVVILTNEAGVVQKSWACRPAAGAEQEIDEIGEVTKGAYVAYSFANISVENVCNLLGLTAGTVPAIGATPTALAVSGTITQANAANKTATINGNGFDPTAADNGYGEKGIPMSNVQTIAATETEKDLIVVRLLAKIKLSIKNETGAPQHIKYATISNVTKNEANNLKLLPKWTSTDGKDNMDVTLHGDLQPNLNGTPTTIELNVPNMATTTALANNDTREVTFYINECKKPTVFYLTIGLGDATNTNEYRYALIDNKGATTADDDKWDYIARNDYRIIPIILDDYKLEIIPYDFPPIGVYPVSVSEIDNVNHIYNFTFHDYGHFHLLPRVTKGNTTDVKFNVGSGDYWTLNTDWAGTWSTYDVKDGTAQPTGNYDLFYREETATADADDAGGIPVWYANDGVAGPQWRPDVSKDYQPFIFGYIADPGAALAADQKIYHEMKIKLYVGGTYRRDMIYRFYMTLSSDQMLYRAPGLAPAPRLPHWK
jgi:hypothetical protein